jgi:hypothetical protein
MICAPRARRSAQPAENFCKLPPLGSSARELSPGYEMRIAMVLAFLVLSACASDKLALAPPAGVDLTGNWRLNEADSDDPMRLTESQAAAVNQANASPSTGRGSRAAGAAAAALGPATPSIGILGAGLRWPGKSLQIKQIGGVVAFTSDGRNVVYQPGTAKVKKPRFSGDDTVLRDSDRRRDAPPPISGWEGKSLVVRSADPDDDMPPYEQRFSVSPDGQRLLEIVGFRGGRSSGFTMSRVWDRAP